MRIIGLCIYSIYKHCAHIFIHTLNLNIAHVCPSAVCCVQYCSLQSVLHRTRLWETEVAQMGFGLPRAPRLLTHAMPLSQTVSGRKSTKAAQTKRNMQPLS